MSKKTFLNRYAEAFAKEGESMNGIDMSLITLQPKKRKSGRPWTFGLAAAAALTLLIMGKGYFEKTPEPAVSEDFKSETYAMLVNLDTNYEFDSWTLWAE